MSLTWKHLNNGESASLWENLSAASTYSTFFHSKAWSNVMEASFSHWSVCPIALEFSDGNISLLPLMARKQFSLSFYRESMFPGVYGGPLFLRTPTQEHWLGLWNEVSRLSNVIMYGNPFFSHVGGPQASTRRLATHALDLTPGISRVTAGFRKGHRADAKVARKHGVETSIATSLEEVGAYFAIYQQALLRWGKKASGFYPLRLFQNLFQLPTYGKNVKLWVARYQGLIIAGIWVLYQNNHAVYWHGAQDWIYSRYHPTHALVTTAIEDACKKGIRWFDFNPSGGLVGVEHFKRGFGANRIEFLAYRRLGSSGKAFRVGRYIREAILRAALAAEDRKFNDQISVSVVK